MPKIELFTNLKHDMTTKLVCLHYDRKIVMKVEWNCSILANIFTKFDVTDRQTWRVKIRTTGLSMTGQYISGVKFSQQRCSSVARSRQGFTATISKKMTSFLGQIRYGQKKSTHPCCSLTHIAGEINYPLPIKVQVPTGVKKTIYLYGTYEWIGTVPVPTVPTIRRI